MWGESQLCTMHPQRCPAAHSSTETGLFTKSCFSNRLSSKFAVLFPVPGWAFQAWKPSLTGRWKARGHSPPPHGYPLRISVGGSGCHWQTAAATRARTGSALPLLPQDPLLGCSQPNLPGHLSVTVCWQDSRGSARTREALIAAGGFLRKAFAPGNPHFPGPSVLGADRNPTPSPPGAASPARISEGSSTDLSQLDPQQCSVRK